MSQDYKDLASSLFKDPKAASLLGDKQKLMSLLSSLEGQQLIAALSKDGGESLKKAAEAFSKGDTKEAQNILSPMLSGNEKLINNLKDKAK